MSLAEAEPEQPATSASLPENPAALPHQQWRVYWAHHEVKSQLRCKSLSALLALLSVVAGMDPTNMTAADGLHVCSPNVRISAPHASGTWLILQCAPILELPCCDPDRCDPQAGGGEGATAAPGAALQPIRQPALGPGSLQRSQPGGSYLGGPGGGESVTASASRQHRSPQSMSPDNCRRVQTCRHRYQQMFAMHRNKPSHSSSLLSCAQNASTQVLVSVGSRHALRSVHCPRMRRCHPRRFGRSLGSRPERGLRRRRQSTDHRICGWVGSGPRSWSI